MRDLEVLNRSGGFLVVRRLDWFSELPIDNPVRRPPDRFPAVSLSHEEIRIRYRGFDGWPWPTLKDVEDAPFEEGLLPLEQYELALTYYAAASKEYVCDLIYLHFSEDSRILSHLSSKFRFLGYDYGYYLSETGVYSALFHEVIYGLYADMKSYARLLNDHLLLSSYDQVRELDKTRNELLKTDADLERDDEEFRAVAIYGAVEV